MCMINFKSALNYNTVKTKDYPQTNSRILHHTSQEYLSSFTQTIQVLNYKKWFPLMLSDLKQVRLK